MVGGNKSSGSSSSGGFNALPDAVKTAYSTLGSNATAQLLNGNGVAAFTPLAQTADETQAYNVLRNNDPMANLQSNIAAQMNPYNSYVIDEINRQGQGQNSQLQSTLNQAGLQGAGTSNKSILGANDIDLSRQNQIGAFLQGQYNTSLNNALTTIPGANADYAANLAGIGTAQRDLASQNSQAGVQALLAAAQAIGVLPTAEGSSKSKSSGIGFSVG